MVNAAPSRQASYPGRVDTAAATEQERLYPSLICCATPSAGRERTREPDAGKTNQTNMNEEEMSTGEDDRGNELEDGTRPLHFPVPGQYSVLWMTRPCVMMCLSEQLECWPTSHIMSEVCSRSCLFLTVELKVPEDDQVLDEGEHLYLLPAFFDAGSGDVKSQSFFVGGYPWRLMIYPGDPTPSLPVFQSHPPLSFSGGCRLHALH